MIAIISLCLSLIQLTVSFSSDWSTEFDYNTYIDENQLFKLYWTVYEDDIIEFGIEVEATGWIALGISPRGQMPNSDIAIGWVDDDGNAFIQDRYTEGRSAPLYDNQQNVTLIEGEEVDGMTRLRFERPKYSCDNDDLSLGYGTTRLIWAFHETKDPESECFDSSTITMHTNMGSQSINLDSGVPEEIELEDDVEYIDFLMDEVQVPATDTTYYCKLFKIPRFNETQHVVKLQTIVEEGNEALVHHLVVYDCPEFLVTDPSHVGTEAICDEWDTNMPSKQCKQSKQLYIWAVGGNDVYMPETAGIPISGDSDYHYILVEMHYDNPLEKSGLVDSSGFRMYFTPTLREQDAGALTVGLFSDPLGIWVPGGLNYAHNAAFMTSECSKNTFPQDGIKVFGSSLHQHTIGRALNFRHIRNGTELPPIDTNLDYDFNYQQTIMFEEPIILLPGDEFILDCWTNSSLRNTATIGGESSQEEMCVVTLYYYPEIDLQAAATATMPNALATFMKDAQKAGYLNGTEDDIDEIFDVTYDFSSLYYDATIDGAQEFYDRLHSVEYEEYNLHYVWCFSFDGIEYTLYDWNIANVSRSEDFIPYDLNVHQCDSKDDNNNNYVAGECVESGEYTPSPIDGSDPSNEGVIFTTKLCMIWIASLITIMML